MARLAQSEIDSYQENGFVVPKFRLSGEKLEKLQAALDATLRDNAEIRPEKLVSVHIAGQNREGVVGHSAFLDLAHDQDILDLVSAVLGEDLILWGCQVFCKPAGDGLEVPWHQDGQYWPIRPLANCSVWLALDDSKIENGCLRVIPGSHKKAELFPHILETRGNLTLNQRVDDASFAVETAADVELEAGQMSLHDVYMIHGSNPNTSSKRRAGVVLRYMPATSHFKRDMYDTTDKNGFLVDFSTRPLWLVRGQDRTGKNDFNTGHDISRKAG